MSNNIKLVNYGISMYFEILCGYEKYRTKEVYILKWKKIYISNKLVPKQYAIFIKYIMSSIYVCFWNDVWQNITAAKCLIPGCVCGGREGKDREVVLGVHSSLAVSEVQTRWKPSSLKIVSEGINLSISICVFQTLLNTHVVAVDMAAGCLCTGRVRCLLLE